MPEMAQNLEPNEVKASFEQGEFLTEEQFRGLRKIKPDQSSGTG